jgi:hypothetical protein
MSYRTRESKFIPSLGRLNEESIFILIADVAFVPSLEKDVIAPGRTFQPIPR